MLLQKLLNMSSGVTLCLHYVYVFISICQNVILRTFSDYLNIRIKVRNVVVPLVYIKYFNDKAHPSIVHICITYYSSYSIIERNDFLSFDKSKLY